MKNEEKLEKISNKSIIFPNVYNKEEIGKRLLDVREHIANINENLKKEILMGFKFIFLFYFKKILKDSIIMMKI